MSGETASLEAGEKFEEWLSWAVRGALVGALVGPFVAWGVWHLTMVYATTEFVNVPNVFAGILAGALSGPLVAFAWWRHQEGKMSPSLWLILPLTVVAMVHVFIVAPSSLLSPRVDDGIINGIVLLSLVGLLLSMGEREGEE